MLQYLFRLTAGKQEQGPGEKDLKVQDINEKLNELAAAASAEDKTAVLQWLVQRSSARMLKWITQIILKDLKVTASDLDNIRVHKLGQKRVGPHCHMPWLSASMLGNLYVALLPSSLDDVNQQHCRQLQNLLALLLLSAGLPTHAVLCGRHAQQCKPLLDVSHTLHLVPHGQRICCLAPPVLVHLLTLKPNQDALQLACSIFHPNADSVCHDRLA